MKVLKGIEPKSIDMIFADPPYFLSTGNGKVNVNGQYIKFDKGLWDRVRSRDEKDTFNRNGLSLVPNYLNRMEQFGFVERITTFSL